MSKFDNISNRHTPTDLSLVPPNWFDYTQTALLIQDMIHDCYQADMIECMFEIGATDYKGDRI